MKSCLANAYHRVHVGNCEAYIDQGVGEDISHDDWVGNHAKVTLSNVENGFENDLEPVLGPIEQILVEVRLRLFCIQSGRDGFDRITVSDMVSS